MGRSQNDTLQRPKWIKMVKRGNVLVKLLEWMSKQTGYIHKYTFNCINRLEMYTYAASGVVYEQYVICGRWIE